MNQLLNLKHIFYFVNILPENIHIPNGAISIDELHQYCIDYEMNIKALGGLDFQLLGIGRTGHIGFNEPGSHLNSGTRIITLSHITRIDAAPSFFGIENVPRKAITMGIGTVKDAKRIVLLAWGSNKSEIIKETIGTYLHKVIQEKVSFWHDVELYSSENYVRFICEIPKLTKAKNEISTQI